MVLKKIFSKGGTSQTASMPTAQCLPAPLVEEPPPTEAQVLAVATADAAGRESLVSVKVTSGQSSGDRCDVITEVHLRETTLETPIGNVVLSVHGGEVLYRIRGGEYLINSLNQDTLKKTGAPVQRTATVTEKQAAEQATQSGVDIAAKAGAKASLTGLEGNAEASAAVRDGANDKQVREVTRSYTQVDTYYPCIAATTDDGVSLRLEPPRSVDGSRQDNTGCPWNDRLFSVVRGGEAAVMVDVQFRPRRKYIAFCEGTGEFEAVRSPEQHRLVTLLLAKLVGGKAWDLTSEEVMPARGDES